MLTFCSRKERGRWDSFHIFDSIHSLHNTKTCFNVFDNWGLQCISLKCMHQELISTVMVQRQLGGTLV